MNGEVRTLQILRAVDVCTACEACKMTTEAAWWHLARLPETQFHRCDRLRQAKQLHWEPGRSDVARTVPQEYNWTHTHIHSMILTHVCVHCTLNTTEHIYTHTQHHSHTRVCALYSHRQSLFEVASLYLLRDISCTCTAQDSMKLLKNPAYCNSVITGCQQKHCNSIWNMQWTRSAIADCTACRAWNVKRTSFVLGSGLLGTNFIGSGSSPAKMLIPYDRQVIALQLCRWKFLENKTL